jgi:hypothetical protein
MNLRGVGYNDADRDTYECLLSSELATVVNNGELNTTDLRRGEKELRPSENRRRAEPSPSDEIWSGQSAQPTSAFVGKLPFFR